MRRGWVTVVLAATLASCVHYTPAPPRPEVFPAALAARRLDEKPAGAAWGAADLLAAALARNPQVAEARVRYLTAVSAARTARLSPGLTLTLTAEYADERPRWGGGGAADLPLDTGGRRATRLTTADLQALQAWYDYGEAAWAVRTALTKARAERASARVEFGLAKRAVDLRLERSLRLDQRVAAGEDDRTQGLSARKDLADSQRRWADAGGRDEAANIALAKALGVGPDAVRELVVAPEPELPMTVPTEWRRDAALSRSDVLRAMADYDLAEAALRLEVAKQYPEVRLGPGYMYDHGVNKLPFNLSLALPTYDLNQRAIVQAEAARAAAGRSLERVQADALAAVDTALEALVTARAGADYARTNALPAARRAAANAARAMRAGAADRIDALAAEAAEIDAELSVLDGQRATAAALADFEDAVRRAFDPTETAVLETALTRPGGAK